MKATTKSKSTKRATARSSAKTALIDFECPPDLRPAVGEVMRREGISFSELMNRAILERLARTGPAPVWLKDKDGEKFTELTVKLKVNPCEWGELMEASIVLDCTPAQAFAKFHDSEYCDNSDWINELRTESEKL